MARRVGRDHDDLSGAGGWWVDPGTWIFTAREAFPEVPPAVTPPSSPSPRETPTATCGRRRSPGYPVVLYRRPSEARRRTTCHSAPIKTTSSFSSSSSIKVKPPAVTLHCCKSQSTRHSQERGEIPERCSTTVDPIRDCKCAAIRLVPSPPPPAHAPLLTSSIQIRSHAASSATCRSMPTAPDPFAAQTVAQQATCHAAQGESVTPPTLIAQFFLPSPVRLAYKTLVRRHREYHTFSSG